MSAPLLKSAKSKIEERLRAIGRPKDDISSDPNEPFVKKWDRSLEKFSNVIEKYYNDNRQSKEEFDKKKGILEEIEGYLAKNVFNKPISGIQYEIKAVVPFGSSASGLGMKEGDLDMTICVHPPLGKRRTEEIKERSNKILSEIYKKIKSGKMLKGRKMKDMSRIDGARVPIINGLVDDVELDISISMTVLVSAQYLASKFIDAYEKYNRKFILLAAYVKYWSKTKKTDENEDYYKTVSE
ncbi:hypothetical protein GCK72_022643 [Caenorhabditis remanei]|nr:hypothetical protein GCK72_022643 [Caenorhabditis remanei]KAF1746190.1 hypothetical protein GCK72_022643 [Caenorhabditis remanei]